MSFEIQVNDGDGQEIRRLYWRTYQDNESVDLGGLGSFVQTTADMEKCIKIHFLEDSEELPPVFEPVLMTETEFKNLPEFGGY